MITGLQGRLVPLYHPEAAFAEGSGSVDAGGGMLVNSLSGPEDRAENRAGNGRITLVPPVTSEVLGRLKASENASEQPAQARTMTCLKEACYDSTAAT